MPLLPLEGFTIGVTADRRAGEQAELLRRRGADVVQAPTITTTYLASEDRLRRATNELVEDPPDYLVVTTGIGLRAWVEAAQSWGRDDALLEALRRSRIVARGPKAAAAVQTVGLDVWRTAPDERMEGVRELLADVEQGAHVAVQCFGDDTAATRACSGRARGAPHDRPGLPVGDALRRGARAGARRPVDRRHGPRGDVHVGACGARALRPSPTVVAWAPSSSRASDTACSPRASGRRAPRLRARAASRHRSRHRSGGSG